MSENYKLTIMKELSIEQKVKRYDEAIEELRGLLEGIREEKCGIMEEDIINIFPELKESEEEESKKWILEYLYDGMRKSDEQFKGQFKAAIAWLEKQGKKETNSYCKENCKGYQETGKCYADGDCEAKRKAEQMSTDNKEIDGEDYGIDGLWHAQRILEETLGSVDGYQTDDGILEHKAAITAVKKLYEQKPSWSEEDENRFNNLIFLVEHSDEGKATKEGFIKFINRLKSLKERYTWKPSDEQIKALTEALSLAKKIAVKSIHFDLAALLDTLKKLKR